MNSRVEHRTKVGFDLITGEQRQLLFVVDHVFGVGRHNHPHEVFGDAEPALALNDDLVDLFRIKIADRAFDKVALFVDFRGRGGFERQLANLLPHTLEVIIVAFDLGLGALCASSAHNQTRTLWHVDLLGNLFEFLTVGHIGDFA